MNNIPVRIGEFDLDQPVSRGSRWTAEFNGRRTHSGAPRI